MNLPNLQYLHIFRQLQSHHFALAPSPTYTMTRLTLIVAATRNNGIGKNSQLPWRLAKEMAYFKRVTSAAPDGVQTDLQ